MEQINLNLIPNGILAVCHVSQYDNTGRKIRFHLFNGSDTYALSGTETITLRIRKTNGEILIFDIPNTASDYIELTVLQQMTDVSGDSICEFRLTDSGLDIGSFNFKMKIEPDAFDGNLSISEVSGNIVTFKTDLAEDLIKLDVDLEPIQDLHGYDGAWRAGIINQITVNRTKGDAGAYGPNVTRDWDYTKYYVGLSYNNYYAENMITSYNVGNDIVSVTQSRNAYGIAFPVRVKSNHQYYVGCTFGGTVKLAASYFDSTGSLITYDYNIGTSRIITTPDNCSTLVLVVYDGAASGVSVSASNIFINDPATETSYIPYSNICPIIGHDSAQLVRTGKNLIDTRGIDVTVAGIHATSDSDGNISLSGTRDSSTGWKSIKTYNNLLPGNYRFSTNNNHLTCLLNYTQKTSSFTVNKGDIVRLALNLSSGDVVNDSGIKCQIEHGWSASTPYEPYKSDPTPITVYFGQTIYEGHLDSTNRKVLVTKKGVKIKDLTWSYVSSFTYFSATVSDIASNTDDGQVLDGLMCEVYTNRTPTQAGSGNKNGSIAGFYNAIRIKDLAYDNKDDLINAVGDYLIVYPLAEPFYIDLSQEQTEDVEKTAVASFETSIQRPLETSEHYFSCSQAEGTPTPDNPIPITGVSEITAYRTGKNLTNIAELPYTVHWGTDAQELVSFLNTLPIGVYTISNKYRINELPGNNKVQHGRFYITALIDGSQTPVFPYSVVTDTSPTVGKIYEESGTFEITASNKGKFNHAYRYCDQDATHTGNDRGSYTCYDIQLEKASSATPYEPYSGESITVSLGGTYYGGKLVQKEDGSRKLILSWGACDLGSATYQYNSTYNVFISDFHTIEPYAKDNFIAKCQIYNYKGSYNVVKNNNMSFGYIYDSQFCFRDDRYNQDPSAFKAGVSGVYVYYELATPIEINLPDGDPLTTIAGENNVYCNTGDTALTYYFNMVADPIRIPALVGTNNVYSDAGDVDVEYYTTLEGGND